MENNQQEKFFDFIELPLDMQNSVILFCDYDSVCKLFFLNKYFYNLMNDERFEYFFKILIPYKINIKGENLKYKQMYFKLRKLESLIQNTREWCDVEKIISKNENFENQIYKDFGYQIGLKLYPKSSELFGNYANLLFTVGVSKRVDSKIVIDYYNKAIQCCPENIYPLSNFSIFLFVCLEDNIPPKSLGFDTNQNLIDFAILQFEKTINLISNYDCKIKYDVDERSYLEYALFCSTIICDNDKAKKLFENGIKYLKSNKKVLSNRYIYNYCCFLRANNFHKEAKEFEKEKQIV